MIGLVTEAIALDLLPVQFIFCLVFLIASSTSAREKKKHHPHANISRVSHRPVRRQCSIMHFST